MAQTPRKNNGITTREAILGAAEALFVDAGFAETSMSQIAKKARVTKSLIHHHFGSKENLWSEVKKRRYRQYSKIQFSLFSKRPPDPDDLKESVSQYFNFLKKNPEFVRLMLWSIIERDSQERDLEDKLSILGVERLREAQKLGKLRSDIDARSIMVMVFCLALNWFQAKDEYLKWLGEGPGSGMADEDYLHDLLTVFFRGVVPQEE
jgi:TetR/AcrR family transcriptional regulator